MPMSTLYFVVAPAVEKVKIGATSRPMARRLSEIGAYSPVPVYLLAYAKAMREDAFAWEKRVHAEFASKRDHGEWFEYDNEVREYVAALVWESGWGVFGHVCKPKRGRPIKA